MGVKTRYTMHQGCTSMRAIVSQIMCKHGVLGFYKGFLPTMLRAFLANGAAFFCIDGCDRIIFGKEAMGAQSKASTTAGEHAEAEFEIGCKGSQLAVTL